MSGFPVAGPGKRFFTSFRMTRGAGKRSFDDKMRFRMTRGEERSGEGLLGDEAVDDLTGLVGRSVWGGVEAGETGGADCETAEAVVC